MEKYAVPSLCLGVVKGDQVAHQAFFGYKDLENKLPPDGQTRYACASLTKAMTAVCLGMLKDEGKVDWETPVIEYLPEFRLYDEYATLHVTLRDMLSHNTGVPRHDNAWYRWSGKSSPTTDYVRAIRHMKPNKGFRGGYEYNNFMFTVAGYVVERVSGMPWSQFITTRLFEPLGMVNTTATIDGLRLADNRALPYMHVDGKPVLSQYNDFDGMAGCGCVNSTLEDMLKLASFNIGKGEYKGRRLVSEKVMDELFTPRNVIPARPGPFQPEIPLSAYAFGWTVQPFRGHVCLQHSGMIDGFSSFFTFMPLEKTGVVALCNMENTSFHRGAATMVYDLLLGVESEKDWAADFAAMDKAALDELEEENRKVRACVKPDACPTHPLADYAGKYVHPGYGVITVLHEDNGLSVRYNGKGFSLKHSHYDCFYVAYDVDTMERLAPFAFQLASDGSVACLMAMLEPALKEPICFARKEG